MREIKFRFWHKGNNAKMSFDLGIIPQDKQSADLIMQSLGARDGLLINPNDDRLFITMQYTGLKDKNGKEIYEGDIFIVRELHDGDEYIWNNEKQTAIPQTVTWNEKSCGFEFGLSTRIAYQPGHFEVIGNIYENPELLEEK